MKKDYNSYLDDLLSDIKLPSDEEIKQQTKAEKVSIAHKGRKHSEASKHKFSISKLGHKRSEHSVKKSIEGSRETKWLQLLEKYPLDLILSAQKKHDNHQNNVCNELKCNSRTLHKLCNHYKIEIPKKTKEEKQEWAKKEQSNPILAWKCSKKKPYTKVGKPKEYYSVTFCCNSFEPKLHKGNMLNNLKKGTPYRDMFFEYKK